MSSVRDSEILDKQIITFIKKTRCVLSKGINEEDKDILIKHLSEIKTSVKAFQEPLKSLTDSIFNENKSMIEIDLRSLSDALIGYRQFQSSNNKEDDNSTSFDL